MSGDSSDSDATYDPTEEDVLDVSTDLFEDDSPKPSSSDTLKSKPYEFKHSKSELHEISDSDSDTEHFVKKPKLACEEKLHATTSNSSNVQLQSLQTNRHVEDTDFCASSSTEVIIRKPDCKYGSKCYRKNPSHLKEFSHPIDGSKQEISFSGASYLTTSQHHLGFHLTKVKGISDKFNNSNIAVDIKDILSSKHGNLIKSVQFNYMFDIDWLMQQYSEENRDKPLLIVHGLERGSKANLDLEASKWSNIRTCQAKLEIMYGTHHTKMMLLLYESGLRVVIHTANLIHEDWKHRTQGVWLSPVFPSLKEHVDVTLGDSQTHFKKDLLQYLSNYKNSLLKDWIGVIEKHDFTSARVFIIASVPGRHTGAAKHAFGHLKLRKVLEKHGPAPETVRTWPVIGQFSSIGSLGASQGHWLCGEFYTSLSAGKGGGTALGGNTKNLKLIFPSKDNVRTSLEGYPAGGSLPYSIKTATKQPYLNNFLHQWKADRVGRTRASPHIKTYCRSSAEGDKIAWFIETSANLSKAAWGVLEKHATQLMIRSYELGVLFLPQFCVNDDSSFFQYQNHGGLPEHSEFPIPYDLPPTPYEKTDRPWICDIAYTDKPDSRGNIWCPPQ